MVHTSLDVDTDICTMEELGYKYVSPCMFLSHARDDFAPFEYESPSRADATLLPSKPFLQELGAFLWDERLHKILGLCRVSPDDDPWIEKLLSDNGDTIARRTRGSLSSSDGTITQWAFIGNKDGDVKIKALRACKESESGGHVRT